MKDDKELIVFWSERMFSLIRSFAYRFSKSWFMETEDLTQEAYIAVIMWIRLKGDEPVPVKLFTKIVRNRFHMFLRRHRNETKRIPECKVPERTAFCETPDIRLDVLDALQVIPKHLGRNIEDQYFRYKTPAQLASEQSVTKDGVLQRNKKAYRKLREILTNGYGPEEDRKCVQNRWRPRTMAGRHTRWAAWGRLPGQREDDNA